MSRESEPRYSTWIRRRKIFFFWILTLLPVAFGAALSAVWLPGALLGLVSLPFAYIATVISLTAWRFSSSGGNFQDRIHQLLIAQLGQGGPVLDIGCGSAHLLVKLSRVSPGPHIGLDYWGSEWEYSQAQCERNARGEGFPDLRFVCASAAQLPFENNVIDRVVSCLTFHEVQGIPSRDICLSEALRVLAPGGRFVFLDLFSDPKFYRDGQAASRAIEQAGGRIEISQPLVDLMDLPFPLATARVLGHAVLLAGTKS